MKNTNVYPMIRALASFVLPRGIMKRPGSGGTFSSDYCYSVWHRHLKFLLDNGLFGNIDEISRVAEIGPGDSLGIGLASLYCGADEYYAFDVIEHANLSKNLQVSDELHKLFSSNADIPNTGNQINTYPKLKDYEFPEYLSSFEAEYFENRRGEIAKALEKRGNTEVVIDYVVPWYEAGKKSISEVDLIFSQAVMEHVEDIEFAYKEMFRWLRVGGVISHQIDFKTHEMTKEWNGHWYIGNPVWRFLAHGRKYPMNRLPLSSHVKKIQEAGFVIKFVLPVTRPSVFLSREPSVKNVSFTADDMVTSGALIQAVKPS